MPSPTFNSQKIFDSIATNGTTYFSEGVLFVPGYDQIVQRIHFEGEAGDRWLYHGLADQEWMFDGMISAPSLALFNTQIGNIQTAIDDCAAVGATGTDFTLVDSFGNVYDNAQVRTFAFTSAPQIWIWNNAGTLTTGYLAMVKVKGIINGQAHIGATS